MRKNKKHSSLIANIAYFISIIMIFSICVIFLSNYFTTKKLITNSMEKTMEYTLNYYEKGINDWLSLRIAQIDSVGNSILAIPLELRTRDQVFDLLEQSTNYGIPYGVVSDYIILNTGEMIAGDGWIPDEDFAPFERDYYVNAIKNNGLYISTPYIDATDNTSTVITISMPLKDENDQLYGVIARDLSINAVKNMVSSYDASDGSYLYLLDNKNNILFHQNFNYQTTNTITNIDDFSELLFLNNITNKGIQLQKDYDRKEKYFIATKEQNTDWTVGFVYPKSIISQQLLHQILINLCVFIIALAVSILLLIKTIYNRLRPLQEIIKLAKDIERGILHTAIDIKYNDEIGILAETFENTAYRLNSMIKEISAVLNQISKNNLNIHTEQNYYGEFSEIENAIFRITENMNHTIQQISHSSFLVSSNASELSTNAQLLNEGSAKQSEQIEKIVNHTNQIASNISKSADQCKSAKKLTESMGRKLNENNYQMKKMISAMSDIQNASKEIGKVIKVIEDIASQTNIVSLNASIEAEKAGIAGKGFAVVADEVRNLAEKSAKAAKNTTMLIQNSISTVNNGVSIADVTAESLNHTLENANSVINMIEQVTDAYTKQANDMRKITNNIHEMSYIVQTNLEAAEECASTSKELSNQAQVMKDLVKQFQLIDRENETVNK